MSFRGASHGDFLSHPVLGHTPHHAEIYGASARFIRRFLQAHIAGDDEDSDRPASLIPSEAAPL